MPSAWRPAFAFAACQSGAEVALKNDVARRRPNWHSAFSRPGFVTFKLPEPAADPSHCPIDSLFARTSGWSLGRASAPTLQQAAAEVWSLETTQQFLKAAQIATLHVWQRDSALPGEHGFEPGPAALTREIDDAVRQASPREVLFAKHDGRRRDCWVLDIAVVEPNQWWIGCHRISSRASAWPGGVPPLVLPEYAVGRAYLKMAEALEWSALPIRRGDCVVELGSAPGGAAQALLDRGARVVGVDPAEMAPAVLKHPRFTHIRRRSTEVPKKAFSEAAWLAADMNVAPSYTLDAAEGIVTLEGVSIRGLILTLKLANWELVDDLPAWIERVKRWGYNDVRLRQLAFNRREICLIALRSRGQRRIRRSTGRRVGRRHVRSDAPHASPRAPHSQSQ